MESEDLFKQYAFQSSPGKRFAVLGDPVKHSLSPAMHNAALSAMAEGNPRWEGWHYHAIPVPAVHLKAALEWLHAEKVEGINLTLPHKVEALGYVEEVASDAAQMGAVNTLIRTNTGYRGTNTDGYGVAQAIQESFGSGFADRDVWIFGAGGAARGIAVEALNARCARLTVVNRTLDRLIQLEETLQKTLQKSNVPCRFQAMSDLSTDVDEQALLINATSLGLNVADPSPIPSLFLRSGVDVYDSTYGVPNALRAFCSKSGARYADGLSMLVWQGARSLEIWTGDTVPVETMRDAALNALRERLRS